jgi:hypothetical protein
LFLTLATAEAWAQFDNIGTSAANFLKIGVGSRGEAMAGAYVAQVNDITSLYWNIAGLARMTSREVAIARTDWIMDINHVFVGAGLPLGGFGTLAFSVYSLTMDDMEETTPQQPDGTGVFFGASNFAIGLAYARSLTDRFSVGVHVKYIRESISSMSASAFALDVGTQYVTGFRGLTIGMNISNFGSKMRLVGREQLVRVDIDPSLGANTDIFPARLETKSWPLPLSFRLGVSMDIMSTDTYRLTGNLDYNDPRDVNPTTAFGVEYSFKEMFYLRGGYRALLTGLGVFKNNRLDAEESDPEDQFFTFGGGLYLTYPGSDYVIKLDYAYSDLGRLTRAHRFTIGFEF